MALLLLVFSASASASGSHGAKTVHRSTAGLKAHLPFAALHSHASLLPGRLGHLNAAGTNSAIGAGQYAAADLASAGVTFTMPAFSCASGADQEWLLPGIWVFDLSGNLQSQVDVNFNCNFGSKYQSSVICITGGTCDTSLVPNPGDVMEVVFVQTASTAAGQIYDRTQGTAAVAYGTPTPGGNIVLEGDMGPSYFGPVAVPTFNKVQFKTATLNGFYIGDWFPSTLNLVTTTNVQIKSTAASTTKFTTKFASNN